MRKIFFLIGLIPLAASAQYSVNGNSTQTSRLAVDNTLSVPSGCGVPNGVSTLRGGDTKRPAIYFDTCGKAMWIWSPKGTVWKSVSNADTTFWATAFKLQSDSILLRGFINALIADSVYKASQIANRVKYADTSVMLSAYPRLTRFLDSIISLKSFIASNYYSITNPSNYITQTDGDNRYGRVNFKNTWLLKQTFSDTVIASSFLNALEVNVGNSIIAGNDISAGGTIFGNGAGLSALPSNTALYPSFAISKITGLQDALDNKLPATITSPSTGQLLRYDGTSWVNWDSNFLTSFTETDPTVSSHIKAITTTNISDWNGKETSLGNPSTNGQVLASTTGGVRSWINLPTGAVWGSITGTLSSQTDLQNALNAKQNTIGYTTANINGSNITNASTWISALSLGSYSTRSSGLAELSGATFTGNLSLNAKTLLAGSNTTATPYALGTSSPQIQITNGGAYGLVADVLTNGNTYIQSTRVDGTATAYNLLLQPLGGRVLIGTTTDNGSDALQVNGTTLANRFTLGGSDFNSSHQLQVRGVAGFRYPSGTSSNGAISYGFQVQDESGNVVFGLAKTASNNSFLAGNLILSGVIGTSNRFYQGAYASNVYARTTMSDVLYGYSGIESVQMELKSGITPQNTASARTFVSLNINPFFQQMGAGVYTLYGYKFQPDFTGGTPTNIYPIATERGLHGFGTLTPTYNIDALSATATNVNVARLGISGGSDGFVVQKIGSLMAYTFNAGVVKIVGITTSQRDALTASAGDIIYNSTLTKHQAYDGSTWYDLY